MMTIGALKRPGWESITGGMGPSSPASSPAPEPGRGAPGDVLVARQPILDAQLKVVGYEVLYRANGGPSAQVEDAERATSSVIADAFGELGLERLVGPRPAFLNVTRDFLLAVRPLPFVPGRVVLELVEDQVVDDLLLAVLRDVVGHGFALALDDFVYDDSLEPLLELATIVKVDALELGPREALNQLALLKERSVRTVAEKVETREEFALYRDAGFDLFQGYFYARPNIVRGQRVPAAQVDALATVAQLEATGGAFELLEDVIRRDLGLSYKLLRYVNSAFFGLPREVGSVREALTTLGSRTVKQWATVLALAGASGAGGGELISTGLLRARMCEDLFQGDDRTAAERCFTVGLFSVIDALLDTPMEQALAELPLVDEVRDALLHREGEAGRILAQVLAYERGEFDCVDCDDRLAVIGQSYRGALEWADAAAATVAR
jgi:c-di-GMP phosphodiesterase